MATSTKTIREDLVKRMRDWQGVERSALTSSDAALAEVTHPLLRLVIEIIRRDSEFHERIQQFIIDAIESRPVTLSPEDMGQVSALLDRHLVLENRMVDAVQATIADVRGHKMLVEEYLLDYLIQDEKKHACLLQALDQVKRGIYPYA